ncbi:MAG TPA: FAD/NAD(P)-binding protein [Coriobacteriia bacterium]|nr:FAD/NAD(P)-binding protein [Coriobacteriia bacterium]
MTDVTTSHECECGHTKNIFMPREAKIIRTSRPTASEKHITLQLADHSPLEFEPGQILEVGVMGYGEIPIGLASSPTRTHSFDIVVRTVGRVTTAINSKEVGDSLWIRGPLGNGFDLDALRGHDILIVAGGIGLCPTRSLIQYITDRRDEFGHFTLFYGARDPLQLLFTEDRFDWRSSPFVDYHETVDRADFTWTGNVGVIPQLFKKTTNIGPDTRVIVCGPPVMFRFVLSELDKLGVPHENVFVDLERRMKCGVGKCGHCQINDKYCCIDGPVFSVAETNELEEAI